MFLSESLNSSVGQVFSTTLYTYPAGWNWRWVGHWSCLGLTYSWRPPLSVYWRTNYTLSLLWLGWTPSPLLEKELPPFEDIQLCIGEKSRSSNYRHSILDMDVRKDYMTYRDGHQLQWKCYGCSCIWVVLPVKWHHEHPIWWQHLNSRAIFIDILLSFRTSHFDITRISTCLLQCMSWYHKV